MEVHCCGAAVPGQPCLGGYYSVSPGPWRFTAYAPERFKQSDQPGTNEFVVFSIGTSALKWAREDRMACPCRFGRA